jgi:hypothetical protein
MIENHLEIEKKLMKDKFNIILAIITFIAGILIIFSTSNGKDGYWIIPLIIYWTIRFFRNKRAIKKEKHMIKLSFYRYQ